MLGLRRTDEIVPNVGLIARTSDQRRYQFTARKFEFGESCGLESHAETINGCGNRHEATIEPEPRMAKKLNLQESRVVICCLYSLTACRPVEF